MLSCEDDEFTTIRIEWAPVEPVVLAAELITFYAAYPSVAGESSDLDDFTL